MGYFCTSLIGVCRGAFFCMESEQGRGTNLAAREWVPEAEVARGADGTFAPCKGLDLRVALTAKISQEQLEARPEALLMSHCVLLVVLSENTVLGVMIREVSQILAGYFLSSFFVLWINHIPHHSFQCSQDGSPRNGAEGAEDARVKPHFVSLQCAWLAPFQEKKSCSILRCFLYFLKTDLNLQHVGFNSGLFKSVSSLKDSVIAAVLRKRVSSFSSGNKSTGWSTCFSGECSAHVNGM